MIDNEEFDRRVRNSLGDKFYWALNEEFPRKIDQAETLEQLKLVLKDMCTDILEQLENYR